jgi:menaquinone-specific isochorismate synthase
VELEAPGALLDRLPRDGAFAWIRDGQGLAGWGEVARVELTGPDRFAQALQWWRDLLDRLDVDDPVGVPGSGPVAMGSFAFDDGGRSVLVVPAVVLGRRGGRAWLTTLNAAAPLGSPAPVQTPRGVRWAEGSVPVTAWCSAVAEAVGRIGRGELDKVVLARDLTARADGPVDPRWLLHRLAERYPQCWTFACEGLVGATPELLVRRFGDRVESRVLAGTVRQQGTDAAEAADVADAALAAGLLGSEKDLEEHEFAVRSVADILAAHCTRLDVPDAPQVLTLANVAHLATDLRGLVADGANALELAAQLHPTAAVCGTPTDRALTVIRELEGMDRGRYAGPVGWLDSRGDGEWGIALRCAEVSGASVRAFAGCGIVAGSDPDAELAESQAKLVPIRDALEP